MTLDPAPPQIPPPPLLAVTELVTRTRVARETELEAAHGWLLESLACLFEALQNPHCRALLGPVVPGATMARGARVPGTSLELDPVQAAFHIGLLSGWCESEAPTWTLTVSGGDCLGALLALGDQLARRAIAEAQPPPTVRDLLSGLVTAREVQFALLNTAAVGGAARDRTLRTRIASAAVATTMLAGTPDQVWAAATYAWMDGAAIAGSRHRRPWLIGDATSRGVQLALLARRSPVTFPALADTTGPSSESRLLSELPVSVPHPVDAMQAIRQRLGAGVATIFPPAQAEKIRILFEDPARVAGLPVHDFVAQLVRN